MIGKLDQIITLERKTRTATGTGGFTETWAEIASVWANVRAKAGRESLDEGRTNATFISLFTIYNTSSLSLSEVDRIIWQGERYNIRGVRREGSRAIWLVIEAERGVAS